MSARHTLPRALVRPSLQTWLLWFVFTVSVHASTVPTGESRIYADNFRWGTADQAFWFSYNTSSAGTAWARQNAAIDNNVGGAVNSEVFKSFNAVTLAQNGDRIRLRWEYRSLVNTDRKGFMEVGLFYLGRRMAAHEFGTASPITNRPGLVLVQNHSQDFSYVRRYLGSGTTNAFLLNPLTGVNHTQTGRIDGGGWRTCELVVERRGEGVWVSGRLNGIAVPARLVPGLSAVTFDSIRILAPHGGSADNPRFSAVRNVELSVSDPLLPAPIWDIYDWGQAAEIIPGVRHAKFSINSPRLMALNAVRMDLHNPNLRFYSTPRATGYVEGSRETLLRRTTGFVSDARGAGKPLVLAINADFYSPVSSEGTPANLTHIAFSDGVEVSRPRVGVTAPAFVFYKDWRADVVDVNSASDLSNFLQAVGGGGWVLDGHVPTGSISGNEPRTVAGVSIDRRYVYWLTVDGRRGGHSDGATVFETGELLRYFGAHAGLNFDGGGSTTLVRWNTANNQPQILNVPSDQNTFLGIPTGGSVERAVGNHLGVYAITAPEPVPFTDWLAARGVPANLRGPMDDPSGAGIRNWEAYAFNIHPLRPAFPRGREAMPLWRPEDDVLRYTFRINRHATDLNVYLEHSTTLAPGGWTVLPPSALEMLGTPDPRTGDTYFRTTIVPGNGREFLRLRIETQN